MIKNKFICNKIKKIVTNTFLSTPLALLAQFSYPLTPAPPPTPHYFAHLQIFQSWSSYRTKSAHNANSCSTTVAKQACPLCKKTIPKPKNAGNVP